MRRLSLVLALGLLVACSSSEPPAAIGDEGIVTLSLSDPRSSAADVDPGSEPLDTPALWEGELAVLGADLPAAERVVLVLEPPGPGQAPFDRTTEPVFRVGGHRATYGLHLGTPPVTCGGAQLAVEQAGGSRLLVTGVAPVGRSTLEAVAAMVRVRDGKLDLHRLPRRHRPLGRLPAGWIHGGRGSRTVDIQGLRLVRRISAEDRPVVLALRCPEPTRFISPPASQTASDLAHREPSVQDVAGRRVDVGLLGGGVALAVTEGDPGVALLWAPLCCGAPPTAEDLARMVSEARTTSASALAALDRTLRANRRGPPQQPPPGSRVLLSGHDGDLVWDLQRFDAEERGAADNSPHLVAVPPRVCLATGAVGQVGTGWGGSCLDESEAGPPVLLAPKGYFGAPIGFLWGAVGSDVAAVEVTGAGRPPHRVPTRAVAGTPFRRVFVTELAPAVGGVGRQAVELAELQLWGGPLTMRTFDADGHVVDTVTVGR